VSPALLATLVALAGPVATDTRIKESADAAQALQGPLDGAWVLRDRAGRILDAFQIADPANGGAIGAAWRDGREPGGDPRLVTGIIRVGSHLSLTFGSPAKRLGLRAINPGTWRGRLVGRNIDLPVTLRRP